ncbi:hypothetical protein OIU85_024498 [Salix viminalis]|uniref:Protein kinase domain-containing protein n=1 Tax=Salix viminalis TaxID=40686 RepID=A0A9Q0U138_SALVM|nr:hypothetical protein OIU85_024498 [Salix viminalis]
MPFGIVSAWNKRRRSKSQDHSDPWAYKPVEFWQLEDQTPQSTKRRHGSSVFTLKEMEEATSSFNEKNLVGKGGFGRVYRGVLRSGEVVAIKKMELPTFKEAEGEREFRVEVDILSRLEHPNLVSLIGYCADGKHRFLVYEYLQHGNLQDHLNGFGKAKMEWPLRFFIITADKKNISDFGLAKLMPEGQEIFVTARVLGTFGYFDPEYTSANDNLPEIDLGFVTKTVHVLSTFCTGKLTLQSDVYAFGVVLLELLTGRRAVDLNQGPSDQNLVLQVRHILNDRKKLRKVIDPELSRSSFTLESIAMFANLASRCIRIESSERPSMAECVKELQTIIYTNSKPMGMGMGMMSFKMA